MWDNLKVEERDISTTYIYIYVYTHDPCIYKSVMISLCPLSYPTPGDGWVKKP